VHDKAFNIGTEANNVTVAEIADEVAAAVPAAELLITGEAGADPRSYRVDFSRFREVIRDFECEWTVKAGAIELVDAYQRYGLTKDAFDQRFTRLAWLKGGLDLDETLRRRGQGS
jgi:nucleoside-diphosphate-sugar epimerase